MPKHCVRTHTHTYTNMPHAQPHSNAHIEFKHFLATIATFNLELIIYQVIHQTKKYI